LTSFDNLEMTFSKLFFTHKADYKTNLIKYYNNLFLKAYLFIFNSQI